MATAKRVKRTPTPAPVAAPEPVQKPYHALQAWNLYLRQPRMQDVAKARAEDAPDNAIFWSFREHWAVVSSLHKGHPFPAYLKAYLKRQ